MINSLVNNGLTPNTQVRENAPAQRSQADPLAELIESRIQKVQQEQQQVEPPEPEDLQEAVSRLNDFVQNVRRTLSFSVEEQTGTTVVQVIDAETEELIRQIPAEETIKLAASIEEFTSSLFIQEQA